MTTVLSAAVHRSYTRLEPFPRSTDVRFYYFWFCRDWKYFLASKRWSIDPYIVLSSNRTSMVANWHIGFSPYFHFRCGGKLFFWHKLAVIVRKSLVDVSRNCFEIGRRQMSVLPVPPKPVLVSVVEAVTNRPIHCIGVKKEVYSYTQLWANRPVAADTTPNTPSVKDLITRLRCRLFTSILYI